MLTAYTRGPSVCFAVCTTSWHGVSAYSQGHTVYLYNKLTHEADSATIEQRRFTLTRPFTVPTRYLFYTSYDRRVKHGYVLYGILVEKLGTVRVQLDITQGFAASAQVSGPALHLAYEQFLAGYLPLDSTARPAYVRQFVATHPNTYAAPFVLQRYGSTLPPAQREALLNGLAPRWQQSTEGLAVRQAIAGQRNAALGSQVRDFSLPTPQGPALSLTSLRGKYVLLDFWASWCGPCHQEFPKLQALYAQYRARGFEILGISTDKKAEAWLRDLHKQQLPWLQVRDATSAVANGQFGVSMLPTSFLLDPAGKVIAKDLRGDALAARLASLLPTAGPLAPPARVSGEIGQLGAPATLYLSYQAHGTFRQDSARLVNGTFRFDSLATDQPEFATFFLSHDGRRRQSRRSDRLTFYLDKGPLTFAAPDSICQAARPRTPLNCEYDTLEAALRPLDRQRARAYQERDLPATPPARRAALEQQLATLAVRRQQAFEQFARHHPASLVSLDAIQRMGGATPDYPRALGLYQHLDAAVRATPAGRQYGEQLALLARTALGATAPDFTHPSPTHQPARLSGPIRVARFLGQLVRPLPPGKPLPGSCLSKA